MVFQNNELRVFIPFDETQWQTQRDYQGSFVSLFRVNDDSTPGYSASIALMLYPDNPLSMEQIYLNTVTELRKMLQGFSVKYRVLDEKNCIFEYEGVVQKQKMCFFQRIFRSGIICSITGGCSAEIAQDQIPQIKTITEQVCISKGEKEHEEKTLTT